MSARQRQLSEQAQFPWVSLWWEFTGWPRKTLPVLTTSGFGNLCQGRRLGNSGLLIRVVIRADQGVGSKLGMKAAKRGEFGGSWHSGTLRAVGGGSC